MGVKNGYCWHRRGLQLGYSRINTGISEALHENWRNNDRPNCAQKSGAMCGIGWEGVPGAVSSAPLPVIALVCSQWLLGGEIALPNPKLNFNVFIFFKFTFFRSLCRVTSCQMGGCNGK